MFIRAVEDDVAFLQEGFEAVDSDIADTAMRHGERNDPGLIARSYAFT